MNIEEMVEIACAAITEPRGHKWPDGFDADEQETGRENMRRALMAVFARERDDLSDAREAFKAHRLKSRAEKKWPQTERTAFFAGFLAGRQTPPPSTHVEAAQPVAYRWRWTDSEAWVLTREKPDHVARVVEPLFTAPAPEKHLRVTQAADAYVTEQGIEHSGGIVERAFEAGAVWALKVNADDEMYEIGKRDGYEEAVQVIDQKTGGDGEYRYCLGMEDDIRHQPDAATMIQRIVDRFEVLNLLDEATKTGSDQPDDTPPPATRAAGSS